MIAGRRKEGAIRDGTELKAALCTACGTSAAERFDNVLLNTLLDFHKLPRDDPKKDPLELKQTLQAIDPSLGKLSLKQRKQMMAALETQLSQAKKYDLPEYFEVVGGWPPKQPEPEPPRAKPKPSEQLIVSPTPLSGEGDGFTWTQTEHELSITVHVPEGTQKQEVMMQMTPKFGPSQQLVLRARFWPLPLVAGTLQFPVDASEAVWHLDTHSKVTIDLPKIEEKLWPGTPAVFTMGPGPLAEYQIPALPSPEDVEDELAVSTGADGSSGAAAAAATALVAGVAPESVVQKMGQRPNEKQLQLDGCNVLSTLIGTDPGKALGAANARALPVILRILRNFGHYPDVQLVCWRTLVTIVEAQNFVRKVLSDQQGMKLVLAGMEAHKRHEAVLVQLAIACRMLLPATPPRPFVEAGGLELLIESIRAHPTSVQLGEVAGSCLHMLSGVNNIVRRMILRMEAIAALLALCEANESRAHIHEVCLGLTSQLAKGDASCLQLFAMQIDTQGILKLIVRHLASPAVQADGARALAALLSTEATVLTFIAEGGLEAMSAAVAHHGEGTAVENEVVNVLEQAVCAMCEAIGEEAPDDELDAEGMVTLLKEMSNAAHERQRLAAEAKRAAEDAAREAAEAAEAERRKAEDAERERVQAIEAKPVTYSGFSWGSSFDDPRLAADVEDAPDAPRIVELDDD
jgi:hypothetical protein